MKDTKSRDKCGTSEAEENGRKWYINGWRGNRGDGWGGEERLIDGAVVKDCSILSYYGNVINFEKENN